ncbi:MAG: TlpA family protein disulfide reductase [Butyricimonas faecihominis]
MEKGEGPELAKKLGIGAYPTFVLIRPDGVIHDKLVGGTDVDGIIQRVERSMKQTETVGTLAIRYEQGERDKDFLLKYLRALSDASEVRRLREVAGILSGLLTDVEKIDSTCWILFDNNDLAPFHSENYRFLLAHRKQFSQQVGQEKVDRRLGMLYAGVLSSMVWGVTGIANVREIGKVIRTLKTDDKKRLLAYVSLANAYKEKNTGELLKISKKVFPVFSDADVMMMVMPVSVYFRTQEDKAVLREFIQVGRTVIPNLKIQENVNYVTYYFDELEKQM